MSYFSELGLAEPILRALSLRGYDDPTPIQQQAIPPLLQGRDLLGIAQTGTGKTAAFSLPSLHRMAMDPQPKRNAACRMLVMSPTRELAAQIAESIRGYGKYLNLSVQCVFGGVPVGKQARALVPGCDILVATPGRLLDLIDQRALTLRHVEIFVLDEADQMMDLGFIHSLRRVAKLLPAKRQSLFFSATMPQSIAELGAQFIDNPVRVEVAPQSTTAERVEQYVTHVNQSEKQALLTLKLREGLKEGEKQGAGIDRAIVFTRTKHGSDRVVRHLAAASVPAAAIHGNKSQAQRTAALKGFRDGSVRVLVATDIAARGIDVSGVSHVFNFEIPNVPEQYVHRIGRTARAGADGIAISFVAPDERPYIRDIERLTGVKLTPQALPEQFEKAAAGLPAPARHTSGGDERREVSGRERGSRFDGRGDGRGDGRRPRGEGRSDGRGAGHGQGRDQGRDRARAADPRGGQRQPDRRGGPGGYDPLRADHEVDGASSRSPARAAPGRQPERRDERRPDQRSDRPAQPRGERHESRDQRRDDQRSPRAGGREHTGRERDGREQARREGDSQRRDGHGSARPPRHEDDRRNRPQGGERPIRRATRP